VEINTWRHPTPYGYALNGGSFILSACRVVLLPILYGRGKDMSLPIYFTLCCDVIYLLTAVVSVLLLFQLELEFSDKC
jgi:hypothetical protein